MPHIDFPLEPIQVSLIGMHDVFGEEYWGAFQTYVGSDICDRKWIEGRQAIKTHVQTALTGYGQWKNATIDEGIFLIMELRLS